MLADIFENFRNMCLKIYELDPVKVLSAPGFAWQAALKSTKIILDLLTTIHMLLMVEKVIRGEICHSILDMQKLITNKSKVIKIKKRRIFNIGM